MKKLTSSQKKEIEAGSASMMGVATGVLTFTTISNLILDLINRYWKRKPVTVENNYHEGCFDNPECFLSRINFQEDSKNIQQNRITFF